MAGPIGFVGLVAPHIARFIVGPGYRWVIPYSGVLGAVMVVADVGVGGVQPQVLNMPFGGLNYEAILALAPDLISAVDSGITQEEYDNLSQIAPTVAEIPAGFQAGCDKSRARIGRCQLAKTSRGCRSVYDERHDFI